MRSMRPVLLPVLLMHRNNQGKEAAGGVNPTNETALTVSEACIRCARGTFQLLTDCWINGSFPTFDYTYTQNLFSSSIILAISSLSGTKDAAKDLDDFEAATQILAELDRNGNFAAKEFTKHIEAIKPILHEALMESDKESSALPLEQSAVMPEAAETRHHQLEQQLPEDTAHGGGQGLDEPSLNYLLQQPDLDLNFLESSMIHDDFQAFFWPDI